MASILSTTASQVVPFVDLQMQRATIEVEVMEAIREVLDLAGE